MGPQSHTDDDGTDDDKTTRSLVRVRLRDEGPEWPRVAADMSDNSRALGPRASAREEGIDWTPGNAEEIAEMFIAGVRESHQALLDHHRDLLAEPVDPSDLSPGDRVRVVNDDGRDGRDVSGTVRDSQVEWGRRAVLIDVGDDAREVAVWERQGREFQRLDGDEGDA